MEQQDIARGDRRTVLRCGTLRYHRKYDDRDVELIALLGGAKASSLPSLGVKLAGDAAAIPWVMPAGRGGCVTTPARYPTVPGMGLPSERPPCSLCRSSVRGRPLLPVTPSDVSSP